MLSVGAIRFEDGIGGGGQVSAQDAVHMAAALARCRKALVGTGWTFSLLSGEAFTGWRALTIVSSLMSGCGRGHHESWEA